MQKWRQRKKEKDIRYDKKFRIEQTHTKQGGNTMANAIDTTEERIGTVAQETVETQKTEMSKAEICFGALMAIAAIAGMWGVVSLMISLFLN